MSDIKNKEYNKLIFSDIINGQIMHETKFININNWQLHKYRINECNPKECYE